MRLKLALEQEKRRYGQIDDGAGKRYLIGLLYALAGDFKQSLAHYGWYEKECSDDVGEPIHYRWWALSFYRDGELDQANGKLLETMVRNLYLLPALLGFPVARHDLWHSSNRVQPEYVSQVSPELLPELSQQERQWIEEQFGTSRFRRVKDEYISTYHALQGEKNVDRRSVILRRWYEFWAVEMAGKV